MPSTDQFFVNIADWPGVDRPKPPGNFAPSSPLLGGPAYTDAFGARRAPSPWQLVEKYKTLVFAMVAKNANAVCRIPLRLYADGSRAQGGKPRAPSDPIKAPRSVARRLSRDGHVSPAAVDQVYEIRQHPLIDLLDRPDPYGYFSRTKLLSLMVRYCDVVGSAFFVPDWDGYNERTGRKPNRVPDYFWVLFSQYVQPVRMAGSPLISFFQYFNQPLAFERMLWFRQNQSLRDPYGSSYSPTYAGDAYAEQEAKFVAIFDQVLGLGPRPNMIASAKDANYPIGEDQAKRLEQDAVRRQSAGYAGGMMVVRDAIDITPVSYPPADLGGKDLSEYDLHRLASIFGQPPTYYTVDTNLANLQAADQQHARDGVDPRCKMIAETLTHWTRSYDPRLFWSFDASLPEDEELKTRVVDMKLKNGSITINQANEETQYPAVPWGDEPWIPGTLVQPSMAQEQHEQGLETAKAGIDAQQAKVENDKKATDFQYSDEPGDTDSGGGSGGSDGGAERAAPAAIPGGALVGLEPDADVRFDAILTAMERSLGL